ncbi:hypothetical protein CFT12S02225_00795 [Campylobacter fetus subsp. testudinum]|uniref:50S ribosomal protein L22 n=1 Tax=Campylobacter fetus subsp. testudinum TaxID=1507806 RepID=A0AAX0HEJ3_CAMFE|nr:hypothetical protein [Campylobacter fetus]OCR91626.1 hypothetical protein CFT12S02225_00795 [Campylobacter fetus subsp. testudinum]
MAIKDDLNYIKTEISSQEQFLENAIRSERFIKKNKKIIIAIVAAAVIALIAYAVLNQIKSSNIAESNSAYTTLLSNPNDKKAKQTLIEKNPSLFALYAIKTAYDSNSTEILDEASNLTSDPLLKQILQNAKGDNSDGLLSTYNSLVKGYELLTQNKLPEAKIEFSKIPSNSPLEPIAKNLEHYQGK